MTSLPPERAIYANRTLNVRSIDVIGYDLDYTLVHYNSLEWERRAYQHIRLRLAERGWPVGQLSFDPDQVIQGLTLDLELGNLLKVTRFGYVIRAVHGTRQLEFDELRRSYAGTFVELADERWRFVNTLFSLSEATLFAQLVDLADQGDIPEVMGYEDLYRTVRNALDAAHVEGSLKSEILADPDRFIEFDPDTIETLEDQREAGKHLMLITNSDWDYANRIMSGVFDPQLSDGRTWRDLFDTVIVSANKPAFFTGEHRMFRVVDEEHGLLRPEPGMLESGAIYFGGSARRVEESLDVSGDEILYMGDHLFGDVHASKSVLRWRTALIIRELEAEVAALRSFAPEEARLAELMGEKAASEARLAALRMERKRIRRVRADDGRARPPQQIDEEIELTRRKLVGLDDEIAPLAIVAGSLSNSQWGLLMRSGADKSLYARQVERYADVYTSRVSNFRAVTPYAFLRAFRSPLPHDFV